MRRRTTEIQTSSYLGFKNLNVVADLRQEKKETLRFKDVWFSGLTYASSLEGCRLRILRVTVRHDNGELRYVVTGNSATEDHVPRIAQGCSRVCGIAAHCALSHGGFYRRLKGDLRPVLPEWERDERRAAEQNGADAVMAAGHVEQCRRLPDETHHVREVALVYAVGRVDDESHVEWPPKQVASYRKESQALFVCRVSRCTNKSDIISRRFHRFRNAQGKLTCDQSVTR